MRIKVLRIIRQLRLMIRMPERLMVMMPAKTAMAAMPAKTTEAAIASKSAVTVRIIPASAVQMR